MLVSALFLRPDPLFFSASILLEYLAIRSKDILTYFLMLKVYRHFNRQQRRSRLRVKRSRSLHHFYLLWVRWKSSTPTTRETDMFILIWSIHYIVWTHKSLVQCIIIINVYMYIRELSASIKHWMLMFGCRPSSKTRRLCRHIEYRGFVK